MQKQLLSPQNYSIRNNQSKTGSNFALRSLSTANVLFKQTNRSFRALIFGHAHV